jgi:L-alanine-DL-glutamate epimerase and related enzymes of enolase superfamily
VRRRIGDQVKLMVDYNQALSLDEALTRGRALDVENIYWLEEPIRHDDYAGNAKLARELKVPLQIGENFSLSTAMSAALDAQAADYVMPDLERIGGVTGWREAAGIAQSRNVKMSSHLFPEVSAHLLAATPHVISRICRLGECAGGRAARDCRWPRGGAIAAGWRHGVG